MRRRDLTASIAIASALIAHGAVIYLAVESEIRGLTYFHPGWPARVVSSDRSLPPPKSPDKPDAKEPPLPPEFVMGRNDGTSEAVNEDTAPLDQTGPTVAEMSQAWQSLERAGQSDRDTRPNTTPPGENGNDGTAPDFSTDAAPVFATPIESIRLPGETTIVNRKPFKRTDTEQPSPDPTENEITAPEHAAPPAAPERPHVDAQTDPPPVSETKAGAPGTPADPAGRPVVESDRTADAVASTYSARFNRGRVEVQAGDEVRFANVKKHLAAIVDTVSVAPRAEVHLTVTVDAAGQVRNVVVSKSCGAASLDRAFQLAAYESYFEPGKTADGRPVGRDLVFVITVL